MPSANLQPVRKYVIRTTEGRGHYQTYWVRPPTPRLPSVQPPYSPNALPPNPERARRQVRVYRALAYHMLEANDPANPYRRWKENYYHPAYRNAALNTMLGVLELYAHTPPEHQNAIREALSKTTIATQPSMHSTDSILRIAQFETDLASAFAQLHSVYEFVTLPTDGVARILTRLKDDATPDAHRKFNALIYENATETDVDQNAFQQYTLTPEIPLPYIQLPASVAHIHRAYQLIDTVFDMTTNRHTDDDPARIASWFKAVCTQISTRLSRVTEIPDTRLYVDRVANGIAPHETAAHILFTGYLLQRAPQTPVERRIVATAVYGRNTRWQTPDIETLIQTGDPNLAREILNEQLAPLETQIRDILPYELPPK